MADQLVTIGKKPCKNPFQRIQPQTGNRAVDDLVSRIEDEISRSFSVLAACLSKAQAVDLPAGIGTGGGLSAITIPFVWRKADGPLTPVEDPPRFFLQPATADASYLEEISDGLTQPGFTVPLPVTSITVTALCTSGDLAKTVKWVLWKNYDVQVGSPGPGHNVQVASGTFTPSLTASRITWGPVAPSEAIAKGDSIHFALTYLEGAADLEADFLVTLNATNGTGGIAGPPGDPGPTGSRGRRGFLGMAGDDGDDGLPGMPGRDGITPQTWFDLELSYGREDGVGTLAAFGTGSEGTPNFYLRPNTDLNVLTVGTGSPGEVWEYEVTRELQGTLTLDLCVYQCLITPQPSTTATLTASVTKNATDILPGPNLAGISYSPSGTRVTVTLANAHYLPGDRIGVHVNTTNFASGTLMMTAHVSCAEKVIAANSITGPTGPAGARGKRGLPWLAEDGEDGLMGMRGRRGKTGASGAGGITGGSGDATFSGTGVVPVTNVNAPDGFTHAGKIVTTAIVAPATPAAGKASQYVDSTSKNLCSKDDAGNINHGVRTRTAVSNQFLTAIADDGTMSSAQPSFSNLSGSLNGLQFGPLTGDVTTVAGTFITQLQNIPGSTPVGGTLLVVALGASPSTPAAGIGKVYVDGTSKNLSVKDDAGVVKHGVQTKTSVANQFLTAIADDGSVSAAQPAFSGISGTVALSQLGNGSALSVLGQPANAAGTRSDIAASSGSDFPLRERSGVLGFGTLSTAAYGNNSVTYGKLQTTTAGKVLLGRDAGAGTVQELGIDATLKMTSGVLGVSGLYQYTLQFGGPLVANVGTTLPVYLGMGPQDWATNANYGLPAPNPSTSQDFNTYLFANGLTGTGTLQVDLMKNGVSQGSIAFFSIGATGTYLTLGFSAVITGGDVVGIRLGPGPGASITGGSVTIYVVGRFVF